MLFNLIFRLQKEISELRGQVEQMNRAPEPQDVGLHINSPVSTALTTAEQPPVTRHLPSVIDVNALEEITLADNEKETIRRALDRNDGRRKETAKELNISERTLYRKIKEYGLE